MQGLRVWTPRPVGMDTKRCTEMKRQGIHRLTGLHVS